MKAHDRQFFKLWAEGDGYRSRIADAIEIIRQKQNKRNYLAYSGGKDSTVMLHIHMKNDRNNNKMERLNGEIRDREKVMRSLKKEDSAIITGMQIHHNFIRSHMGLDGKTPADSSGVKVEGNNKWITLIQNAKKSQVTKLSKRK